MMLVASEAPIAFIDTLRLKNLFFPEKVHLLFISLLFSSVDLGFISNFDYYNVRFAA